MAERKSKRGGARPGAGRKRKPKKVGRPSDYDVSTTKIICDRLCAGESLRTICDDKDMPSTTSVFRWLAAHEEFRAQYAHAREVQADAIFEEILDIADNAKNDWMERRGDDDAGWQANGEHIQRSKLRIDARKWMAGKLAPKKYGEKSSLELSGADGAPLIPTINVTIGDTEPSPAS